MILELCTGKKTNHNVTVFYQQQFIEINRKWLKATELYPKVIIIYSRKLNHDIERGSKKALRNIQKDLQKRQNLNMTGMHS